MAEVFEGLVIERELAAQVRIRKSAFPNAPSLRLTTPAIITLRVGRPRTSLLSGASGGNSSHRQVVTRTSGRVRSWLEVGSQLPKIMND